MTRYPATATYIKKIADTPQAVWLTVPGTPTNSVASRVSQIVGAAKTAKQEPVFVLYAIPHRDCGSYSAGGLTGKTASTVATPNGSASTPWPHGWSAPASKRRAGSASMLPTR